LFGCFGFLGKQARQKESILLSSCFVVAFVGDRFLWAVSASLGALATIVDI
jgi:F0F1-type ATP synthase assembly protein I